MPNVKNVLVLMCDHHRHDALGCLGNPLARTPNLDALAARSVRFANCFTQSPVCAPARYSLATGRYTRAHGVINNHVEPFPTYTTIAHALQPLGYRRIQIGHMHWTDPDVEDTGYEPWITHSQSMSTLPKAVLKRAEWESQGITRRTTAGPSPRTREQYSGCFAARHAVRQMESAVSEGRPFLCWTAFSEPHPPFFPPRNLYEAFDQSAIALPAQAPADAPPPHPFIAGKQKEWAHLTDVELRQMLAGYYGMVQLVDGYIGEVLAGLDRLGVRDETAVIWTVDHGDQMWEHEMFLKFNMYDGSTHVPLLLDVPGVAAGVRDELVEHVDVMPTICDLLGADCPPSAQGRSLTPLLAGQAPGDWRDAVFSQIGQVQMIRTKDWKLNVYEGEPGELYDLAHDPQEFHNRLADPACREVAASLHHRLRQWENDNGPDNA